MFRKSLLLIFFACSASLLCLAQKAKGPFAIKPVGIVKDISDSVLLDIIQRQTFRYFWEGAHPVSGLALERSDTVLAEHYWDYINEANGQPNFSTTTFGPDAAPSVVRALASWPPSLQWKEDGLEEIPP